MSLNFFICTAPTIDSQTNIRERKETPEKDFNSCGLWIQASYINHRCNGNVFRAFIGDMMIVRATRDLEADTELLFPYYTPSEGSQNDPGKKLKNWGFTCECAMCFDSRSTAPSVLRQREMLRMSFEKTLTVSTLEETIECLLDELNQTYSQPAVEVPRILVGSFQLVVAHDYAFQNETRKSIVAAGKVLISIGFVITGADHSQKPFTVNRWGIVEDNLVDIFVILRNAFLAINATMNSKRADKYAKTAYKMIIGEDDSFDSVWGA
jgi:hypothetical protein